MQFAYNERDVTSGVLPTPSWSTSLLQSMGNEARFAVLSLPNGTVYSNTAKTIEKLDLCDIER